VWRWSVGGGGGGGGGGKHRAMKVFVFVGNGGPSIHPLGVVKEKGVDYHLCMIMKVMKHHKFPREETGPKKNFGGSITMGKGNSNKAFFFGKPVQKKKKKTRVIIAQL